MGDHIHSVPHSGRSLLLQLCPAPMMNDPRRTAAGPSEVLTTTPGALALEPVSLSAPHPASALRLAEDEERIDDRPISPQTLGGGQAAAPSAPSAWKGLHFCMRGSWAVPGCEKCAAAQLEEIANRAALRKAAMGRLA